MVIEKDNIVVNGAGYTVQGAGSGNGITLSGRTNVTLQNMTIKAFKYGIYLEYPSNYDRILGNNITANNWFGLYFNSFSISDTGSSLPRFFRKR
jgi:hypothetical protein